jgi:hypothetical protein
MYYSIPDLVLAFEKGLLGLSEASDAIKNIITFVDQIHHNQSGATALNQVPSPVCAEPVPEPEYVESTAPEVVEEADTEEETEEVPKKAKKAK